MKNKATGDDTSDGKPLERDMDGTMELSVESSEAYKAKEGKWRTDFALAVCDSVYMDIILPVFSI